MRLQAFTMIDQTIAWIETCSVPGAIVHLIANEVKLAWLTRYHLPCKIVDIRKEFLCFTPLLIF